MAKKTSKKAVKKTVRKTKKKAAKKTTKKKPIGKMGDAPAPKTNYPEQESRHFIMHNTKQEVTRKDKTNSLLFIGLLIAIIVLLIVISPVGSKDVEEQMPEIALPHLLAAFPSEVGSVGETVMLSVEARNMKDVIGFQMELAFNSKVLKFKKLYYDEFFGPAEGRICVPPTNNGGRITKIACAKLPSKPGEVEGISGNGNLLFVEFDVVGRGDANIQIDNVNILNVERIGIDHQVIVPRFTSR